MAIRILIVDDSAFVRKAVRRMLEAHADLEVAGEAADGRRALEAVRKVAPDVVTLDLRMPGWDGLETLHRIMAAAPVPVVVLSSYAHEGAGLTLQALTAGAVDFIDKSRVSTMELYDLESELVDKVKAAASSRPLATESGGDGGERRVGPPRSELFILGASTGGPRAVQVILSRLPADFPARVLVVQHMPAGFTEALARRLDESCPLPVRELSDGDRLVPGRVCVAPGAADLAVGRKSDPARVTLRRSHGDARTLPSIDRTLESAAAHYGRGLCAAILTGMGEDGLVGARAVRAASGIVIAEAPSSCIVYGMPRAVSDAGLASFVAPVDEIPTLMLALVSERNSAGSGGG